MSGFGTIIGYGLREALRRKVFAVVLLLTAFFLALFWLANHYAFRDLAGVGAPAGIDARAFVGATIFGLAMFATLFLGAVAVCAPYVLVVYFASMLITGLTGHWWPDRIVRPGIELAAAVALIAALSLLGSVFLTATANGIAIFMVFGAGLVAGLLGTIGHALASHTLERAAKIATYVVPVEALYQDALQGITADQRGLTKFVLELGPFGGAYTGGVGPRVWAAVYLCLVAVAAVVGFSRRDL